MRALAFIGALVITAGVASAQRGPAQFSDEWYQQFRGPYSAPAEPLKILENIYYVGSANISSWLITTPEGHILIDTGMTEMHDVVKNNITKLGFKLSDVKILLHTQAHFDHVAGHAAMQKATGAQVFAVRGDAESLESGKDISALGAVGWEPVKVARVLQHNDTVTLGGTTLRAVHNPGHTQGTTTWITTVKDGGRDYTVAFLGSMLPNGGVPLMGNPRHKTVIDDTRVGLKRLKAEKAPDLILPGHAQNFFKGKIDQIKAGARPHPLLNGDQWMKDIAESEASFEKRVAEERAKQGTSSN